MTIYPFLFYIIVTLVILGSAVGFFLLGQKLEVRQHRKSSTPCKTMCFIVLFFGVMAAYISTDDRSSHVDLMPTLIIANEDGSLSRRKIITPYYKGIPVHPKIKGGFYIVENATKDTIGVVTAFYHFYGQPSSFDDSPEIDCTIPPSEASKVKSPPVAIVGELPSRRSFKVSRLGNSGRGRSATYIIPR